MPVIRIDADVMQALKGLAEPFVDTPGSVIRRLLEDKGLLEKAAKPARGSNPAPGRGLTPQAVYEQFLLAILEEQFAGRGDKRAVTQAVIERMTKRGFITNADLELVATGETKAENTISWGRNALKERGLLSRVSARGIWELTAEGRDAAKAIRLPVRRA